MDDARQLDGPRFEIDIASEEYPAILRDTPDPPRVLRGIGNPAALRPGIAIIGSRKATPYGLACAEAFASHIASRGIPIISGGAMGCDQCAHRMALDAGCPTVVVFGSGADVTYPKRGRALFQRVIDAQGAVISENPWGTQPLRPTFVRRNRIIAGLAALVLIVEAGLPSGTFSTADAALRANRDVAAVPGSITSPNSRGTNHLIAQGAYCVVDTETLDSAIELAWAHSMYELLSDRVTKGEGDACDDLIGDDPVLRALAAEALSAQQLAAYFDFSPGELSRRLASCELDNLVQRGMDGRYQLVPRRQGRRDRHM